MAWKSFATKHEPIDTKPLTSDQLAILTNKINGSKFNQDWTLHHLVEYIAGQVEQANWALQPGESQKMDCHLDQAVGLVNGRSSPIFVLSVMDVISMHTLFRV